MLPQQPPLLRQRLQLGHLAASFRQLLTGLVQLTLQLLELLLRHPSGCQLAGHILLLLGNVELFAVGVQLQVPGLCLRSLGVL
jgi:hypothetical protein